VNEYRSKQYRKSDPDRFIMVHVRSMNRRLWEKFKDWCEEGHMTTAQGLEVAIRRLLKTRP
jgi:hypothetical protein